MPGEGRDVGLTSPQRVFPSTKPGGEAQKKPPTWSSASTQEDLQAEYERVRSVMDGQANLVVVQKAFVQILSAAEWITLDPEQQGLGINPMGWELGGISEVAKSNIQLFNPELQEAAIELRGYLGSSWPLRLAFKTSQFMSEFSRMKTDPEYAAKVREAHLAARAAAAAQQSGAHDDL